MMSRRVEAGVKRCVRWCWLAVAAALPPGPLLGAPFPGSDLVTLTTNLSGVSTWPGYRRPARLSDMDVQGSRVAFAGGDLGSLVLNRDTRGVVRRFVSPTIGSNGSRVALAGNICLMEDTASNPEAHWFGLGDPFSGSGTLDEEIGFAVASLGELGLSWTMGPRRTNTFIRTYDTSQPAGPQVTGEWELVHGFNETPAEVQPCAVEGWRLAIVRRVSTTAAATRHWLEVMSLDPGRTVQSARLELPSTSNQLRVTPDGRVLLASSGEEWIRLYRVELDGTAASFGRLSETSVPDLDASIPALGGKLMASLIGSRHEDAVAIFDVSDPAAPVRLATLPLPVPDRLGNPCFLALADDRLLFADWEGAYREADLSHPAAPRWLHETLVTGDTTALSHNGPWVLASEGRAHAVRLLDLGADATDPREVATLVLEKRAESVVWVGHTAYVLEAGGGASLAAIDFSLPSGPRITRRPLPGSILSDLSLATDGTVLVVRNGDARFSHLQVFTLEVPGYPRERAKIETDSPGGAFRGVLVRDGFAYVGFTPVAGGSRLLVFDVRDPAAPRETARVAVPFQDAEITLHRVGDRLQILTYRFQHWLFQVHQFDVSDPAQPVLVGTAQDPEDGSQGEYSVPMHDFLIRTVSASGPTPWGNVGHTVLRADELVGSDMGLQFGPPRAQMLLRRFSVSAAGNTRTTAGRKHSLGTPHRIGDLILLPVGLHGVDVVRADFLPASAPTLVHPPVSRTVAAGRRAILSATVDGALPLTLQWFKGVEALTNGGRISGADTLALVFASVTAQDAGEYRLRVTNAAGAVTSQAVQMSVVEAKPLRLELAPVGETNWKATFSGDPGQVVGLEQSDDLLTWNPVQVSSAPIRGWLTAGTGEAAFSSGSAKARYYRAVVVHAP